jgi:tRNA A37 methylthiotransferase MiaB
MPAQVPIAIAHGRNRVLRELAAAKKSEFQRSFIGSTLEAITLSHFDGERTEALTDNYLKIRLAGHHLPNQWLRARVESIFGDALLANLV